MNTQFLEKLQDKDYFHAWLGQHLTAPLRYRQRKPSPFFLQPTANTESVTSPENKEENTPSTEKTEVSGTATGQLEEEGGDHYHDIEEEDEEVDTTLPYAVRSTHSVALSTVFADATAVLQAVLNGECALRRAEGLRVAYVEDVLYIDGEVRTINSAPSFCRKFLLFTHVIILMCHLIGLL